MEYGHHLMETKFTKDDDYVAVVNKRREDVEFWKRKVTNYADDLDEVDAHVHKLSACIKELEQELENVREYKDNHGGKWARYKSPSSVYG